MNRLLLTAGALCLLCMTCARTTVSDADGNVYRTVRIGDQIWTAENLRTTTFSDGTPIPHVADSIAWHSLSSPGYCYFGNTSSTDTISRFGALYNWYCVDSKKLAPTGWHVPTDEDWDALRDYLIVNGYNWDSTTIGNRIGKSLAARSGWLPSEAKGMPGNDMKDNNQSGFTGYGAGDRYDSPDSIPGGARWKAVFTALRHKGSWWSATQVNETVATVYGLSFCVDNLLKYQIYSKTCGFSVRLVKDRQ